MKILVTGGAGFIGSAVIRYLVDELGHEVVNVDKLTYAGNLESLVMLSNNPLYTFERVDICDRQALDAVFTRHQPDSVMHLAAESHVDRSIDGPGEFIPMDIYKKQMDVNFFGYVRVVQAMMPHVRAGVKAVGRRGRMVFTGTGGGVLTPVPPLLT